MRVGLNEDSQSEWQAGNFEHLRYEYDLNRDDLVIDIGAYRGEWAREIYERYGCKLICIEPGPSIVGFELGQVINKAASTFDGSIKFGGAYYYTSAHEKPDHEYQCFDIAPLLQQYDELALVKINIEGAEYSLLNHIIDKGLHRRMKNLQVQFHLIEDEPCEELYGAIAEKLSKTHTKEWDFPFCWESWKRL